MRDHLTLVKIMAKLHKKSGINLLIKPEEELSISSQFLNWALTYGRYIIIIIQIVVLSVFFTRFKIDRDRTDLKEAVAQKRALIESIGEMETEIKRVQKRLSDIKLLVTNQDIYLRVINFLEKNTPTETTFALLSFSKDIVKFVAISENLKTFNHLLKRIQDEKLLTDIQLEDLKRRADGKVEFRLQAKIAVSSYE
ncbi:hypothetical protein A3D78_06045 [Candidatus Gottesmanbacteria bacterium RIFCSPHIGHO2_02_FULL_39_14]|uniref:Uncharacterized protein n=3 Tax=Candidatus Gottesmaniibacteriota TaxID=1752720 RepID=A0A1F5ZYH9_9BACT|nr:MAG: hypothetical protein A2153_05235 [Candidatus Gottesmanbacteria bacterium RBG_16_38_7b]OGG17414.1 MAG: hypothetical protein A3D78_06045 [Candidatus Gottesmanbacteria bacterium RIFCSPHIGHO2_02_FULL_39_14]OGG31605.1 MAG: hypothetical protein A3I51_04095 [Candidatus Gottesmanbacteria bacterium RIFCSPLOWO2_02_FULL_38_8]